MDDQPNTNSGWIWPSRAPTKRKAEQYESWEERAFAEDAAGVLGSSGCVWPPRSYSCSFCRREFRSAQALGGHMNVHRRDRARLKHLPQSPNQTLIPDSTFPKCPSQTTLLYGTNPNPNNHSKPKIVEGSISLNLVVRRSLHGDEASSCFKRRKIVAAEISEITSAPKEVLTQEIDLELRLGG